MLPALHTRGSPQLAIDGGGPYNTIATGASGSGRLLDLTAGQLAAMRAGALAWVKSVRDFFRWDPASTETADNLLICNPTINVGNPGRLVRCLIPAPEWQRQAAWFVDETSGNDENDGLLSGTAIKTDAELTRRWGPIAKIAQPVVITYLSNPVGQTDYRAQLLTGGSIYFQGTATVSKTGTFSAVTTQDRSTQTPWAVTEATLGAADVGKIIRITAGTAGNIGAYARILKDNGAGSVRVTPFGKFSTAIAAPFAAVTPIVGDTFEVITMTTLNLGNLSFCGSAQLPAAGPPLVSEIVFDTFTLDGNASSFDGLILAEGVKVFYARSVLKTMRFAGYTASVGFHVACGGGLDNCSVAASTLQVRGAGVLNSTLTLAGGASVTFVTADVYFQNSRVSALGTCRVTSAGSAHFDCASDLGLSVSNMCTWAQSGAIPDWGTNNAGHGIKIFAGGGYFYGTKPTVNTGLGAGRECLIGGTDKLLSAVPYFEAVNGAQLSVNA